MQRRGMQTLAASIYSVLHNIQLLEPENRHFLQGPGCLPKHTHSEQAMVGGYRAA